MRDREFYGNRISGLQSCWVKLLKEGRVES